MTVWRMRARRDSNETEIVDYFTAAGCSWLPISGRNQPDGLLGVMGRNVLVEIKRGTAKLRPGQIQWHLRWQGHPVVTIRSVEEAQKLVGTLRRN